MTYSAPEIDPADPVFVSNMGPNAIGNFMHSTRQAAPTSGACVANRYFYTPFWLNKGYEVGRFWWLNGATVGTDLLQAGIFDQNLGLVAASARVLSAGSVNNIQYANCGIAAVHIVDDDLAASQTSFTTASMTLKKGVLYLIGVLNTKGSTADAVASVTGGGTWTSRSTTLFDASSIKRVSIWSCVPSADYTGTLVIDFAGNNQTECGWTVNGFYGVDTATSDGVVQNAVNTGTSTTASATLSAFGSANNATHAVYGIDVTNTWTPETNYVELSDNAGTTFRLASEVLSTNDTSPSAVDGVSGDWGICAVEIKAASAVAIPPMRGYMFLVASGTTATVYRTATADLFRSVSYRQDPGTNVPVPATAILSSNNSQFIPVYGFTRRSSP